MTWFWKPFFQMFAHEGFVKACPVSSVAIYIYIYTHTHIVGGGDSSVVRAPDSWLKGRGFESLLERRENFCADSYFGIRSTPVLPQ